MVPCYRLLLLIRNALVGFWRGPAGARERVARQPDTWQDTCPGAAAARSFSAGMGGSRARVCGSTELNTKMQKRMGDSSLWVICPKYRAG